jgi:hypothetical protein
LCFVFLAWLVKERTQPSVYINNKIISRHLLFSVTLLRHFRKSCAELPWYPSLYSICSTKRKLAMVLLLLRRPLIAAGYARISPVVLSMLLTPLPLFNPCGSRSCNCDCAFCCIRYCCYSWSCSVLACYRSRSCTIIACCCGRGCIIIACCCGQGCIIVACCCS